jgi:HEAT repeat protein
MRGLAGAALKAMGSNAVPAVAQLAAALEDREESVRVAAAEALGAIGPAASAAVPSLVARLCDETEARLVIRTLMQAFGQMGPSDRGGSSSFAGLSQKRQDASLEQIIRLIEGKEVATYH